MKNQKLAAISDMVFKRIFGQEKEIAIELINAFIQTESPVVDIQFLPTELIPTLPTEKNAIVDVLCIDSHNRHFVLEVQVLKQKSIKERVHYYASQILVHSLEKGQKFSEQIPVYIICFLSHILETDTTDWLHRYSQTNEKYPEKKIRSTQLIFIELAKWKKLGIFNLDNVQERWLSFLTSTEKLISMPKHNLKQYPNLKKAVDLLDQSKYTPGQLLEHANYMNNLLAWNMIMIENFDDGFDAGMDKGIEKGIEKGKLDGIELTTGIIRLLKEGQTSLEDIAAHFSVDLALVIKIRDSLS